VAGVQKRTSGTAGSAILPYVGFLSATCPGIDEAKKRLAPLDAHGPTQFAFTFKKTFKPDEEFQAGIDWSSFVPWPAV
jgi:hypothetical protein